MQDFVYQTLSVFDYGHLTFCVDLFFVLSDDDEIPQELLLGKQQLSELGSESAKIKAMGITCRVRDMSLYTTPFMRLLKVWWV